MTTFGWSARCRFPSLAFVPHLVGVRVAIASPPHAEAPLLVGLLANKDPSARKYAEWTGKACRADGLRYELRELDDAIDVESALRDANDDPRVHGIIVYCKCKFTHVSVERMNHSHITCLVLSQIPSLGRSSPFPVIATTISYVTRWTTSAMWKDSATSTGPISIGTFDTWIRRPILKNVSYRAPRCPSSNFWKSVPVVTIIPNRLAVVWKAK
jgi:hypothetical protein